MTPTNKKGNLSESKILAAFIEAGFLVSVPFGNGAPYDLIVDTGTNRLRVQVKTGRLRNGCILFPTQRIHGHHGTRRFKYDENSFDLFAVYCTENCGIYIFPFQEGLTEGRLRIDEPRNNQADLIRWAKDFELKSYFGNLR
jgi:hypothetical protein